MSAMLQFGGRVDRTRGVELQFYLVTEGPVRSSGKYAWREKTDAEPVPCSKCDHKHPQLYAAWRKPRGTWGCWVVFMYNGEEHVPDLSTPISVTKVPRGSRKLDLQQNSETWHGP